MSYHDDYEPFDPDADDDRFIFERYTREGEPDETPRVNLRWWHYVVALVMIGALMAELLLPVLQAILDALRIIVPGAGSNPV